MRTSVTNDANFDTTARLAMDDSMVEHYIDCKFEGLFVISRPNIQARSKSNTTMRLAGLLDNLLCYICSRFVSVPDAMHIRTVASGMTCF